jgi:hypothetical protein
MANKKPIVTAALLCDRVLQEKDGVLTAIRIVDQFTVAPPPAALPPNFVALASADFAVLICVKPGDLTGTFRLSLKIRFPSGAAHVFGEEIAVPLIGGDEQKGVNFTTRVMMPVTEYGLYWFDVLWEGELLTAIPFKLVAAGEQKVAKAGTS